MEKVESAFLDVDENKEQQPEKKKTLKTRIIIVAVIALLAIGFCVYQIVFKSIILSVKVVNNQQLSSSYIIDSLNYHKGSRYYKLIASSKVDELKNNPLINNISLEFDNHCLVINVEENRIIGHCVSGIDESTIMQLILEDGSTVDVDYNAINSISLCPYFSIKDLTLRTEIANRFSQIEDDILFRISEVNVVSFTYEENMVELIMDDGYRVYTDLYGIPYVNKYISMVVNSNEKSGKCLLILSEVNRAVLMKCSEIENYSVTTE